MTWHTGKAIERLLGESNRTKTQAALALGTTVTTLYRWLKKEQLPQRTVVAAAQYFNVTPEWLATGAGARRTVDADPFSTHLKLLQDRFAMRQQQLLERYTREVVAAVLHRFGESSDGREWETRGNDPNF